MGGHGMTHADLDRFAETINGLGWGHPKVRQETEAWRSFVRRLRYKPGFRIEVQMNEYGVWLYFEMRVPNACAPQGQSGVPRNPFVPDLIPVGLKVACPRWKGERMALRDVWNNVIGMEKHEAGEWLRLDDLKPFDPHKLEGPPGKIVPEVERILMDRELGLERS
jgi:hypothetical protein